MTKRKIAVIGVFNIGKNHVKSWANTPGAELVSIADLNPQLCEKVKAEFSIGESYLDYKELLKQSDAEIISVCLPTGLHEQVVTDCLRSGRHVLCEKPPATSALEAERMHECSLQTGKQLGYTLQRRFSAEVEAARRAIADRRIGDVLYGRTIWVRHAPLTLRESQWRFDQRTGGGSLLDLGIHLLDAAWYAMGFPQPVSVSGTTSSSQVPEYCQRMGMPIPDKMADDSAAAWIRFADGQVLTLESSYGMWTLDDQEWRCDLHGTDGAVRMYPGPAEIINRDGRRVLEEPEIMKAHLGVTHDFLQAVENNRRPCADGEQGIMLHKMLDAIIQSASERREISIS
jgi:predicted dehydrogenase